jgi:hypothetical protein
MDAQQVILSLLRAGMNAKRAFEQARADDDQVDWATFVKSPAFAQAQEAVSAALAGLNHKDVTNAVERIRQKQKAFLRGREITELPIEELLQFGQLADAEGVLVRKQMRQLGTAPDFIRWLAEEALPTLAKVAQVVLPIVL